MQPLAESTTTAPAAAEARFPYATADRPLKLHDPEPVLRSCTAAGEFEDAIARADQEADWRLRAEPPPSPTDGQTAPSKGERNGR
ncbi:hypothetical protein AB0O22_23095 [Streptomyces sp. NPDC091204]|uniref:hypothetical protein n=1 Tax=Streptomyces sp. NPDC091204 TaxID=3155299 RepID=UPI00341F0FC9